MTLSDLHIICCKPLSGLTVLHCLAFGGIPQYIFETQIADVDGSDGETAMGSTSQKPLKTILRDHWRGLLGAGLYCALLNGVRNTWMVALPLRGHHIGLSKMGIGDSVAWYRACYDDSCRLGAKQRTWQLRSFLEGKSKACLTKFGVKNLLQEL